MSCHDEFSQWNKLDTENQKVNPTEMKFRLTVK